MDPSDVLSYLKEENPKKQPIATWHTHPAGDPNLSGEDYVGFLHWPEWRHYIVGLRNNKPTVICFEVDGGIVVSTGEFS